jgi:acyl-CoA-binding protein
MFYTESTLDENFQKAIRDLNNINKNIEKDEFLNLYGLYKQALFGNNDTPKPWFFLYKNNNKWNAWKKHYNKSKNQSKIEYIEEIYKIKNN